MTVDATSAVAATEPPPSRARRAPRTRSVDAWLPWIVGVVAGTVVVGPALAGGGLFRLDLVVPDEVPVPRGVWGLGPELPRRVPTWLPVAWASDLLGAPLATKVLLVASIAASVAGAWRLAGSAGRWAGAGAGVLYGLSPFLLTRIGIGHLMVVVTMAVLPWALPDLLRPERSLRRTFLWSAALAAGGFYGGTVAVLVVGVGLAASRGARALGVVATAIGAQAPWLVPSLVVRLAGGGGDLSSGAAFASQARGVAGIGHVLAGHGFWQPPLQVGWPDHYDLPGPIGWPLALAGFVLCGLAVTGTRALPDGIGRRAAALGAIGVGVTVVGSLPGLDGTWADVTSTPLGAPFREAQRYLLLYLVWMAPAAGLGAARAAGALARRRGPVVEAGADVVRVLPLAVGLVLAGPGLWGVDGALEPRSLPAEWELARAAIAEAPGPVVALPWELYLDVPFDDGTRGRLLNPLPIFLGGDVATSSDPEVGGGRQERADPREAALDDLTYALRSDEPGVDPAPSFGAGAADLGFRWVVLIDGSDAERYASLLDDPGLEQVVDGETIDLWQVADWQGAVTADDGTPVPSRSLAEPLLDVDGSGPATWRRPWASGWLRGATSASATPEGLVALPAGDGPVWYWPAALVVVADLVWVGAIAVSAWSLRRGASPRPGPLTSASDDEGHTAQPATG